MNTSMSFALEPARDKMQKKYNVGYSFVTQGVFYASRMISAQHDAEFKDDNYSGLKKVYSIWV